MAKFTVEEQEKINQAIKEAQDRAREAEIAAAARNAIMDAERKKPGKTGY